MEDVGKELKKIISRRDYQQKFTEMIQEVLNDPDVQSFLSEHQEDLTQADIEKSYAKLYEFVQEKRKYQKNDPTMIAPGYEPKLTLNFHYVDVTYVPTEALLAKKRQEEIKSRSFGIGKTYLLGATARELAIKGFTTTLVHFPTFAVEMKQAIGKDQVAEKLDAVKCSPILMMDDIGADAMSSWIRDEVFGVILQYRMQEQLPTFFSSNFTMDELEQHLSVTQRGDEEPLKAKRIMERIRYLTKEIEMTGRNRRNG